MLSVFLSDLGNHDRNSELDEKQLASTAWHESGQALYHAAVRRIIARPASMKELVVIPDGVIWYVPLAALPIKLEDEIKPLISHSKVRVVPTMGLAFGHTVPWRRVQHASIVGDGIVPGDREEDRAQRLTKLQSSMTNLIQCAVTSPRFAPRHGRDARCVGRA